MYAISYDVTDDGRRRRLHELLKGFGRRVQFSVFECELSEAEVAEVTRRAAAEVDEETDSCRLYRLCQGCREDVTIVGKGDRYVEPEVTII